MQTQANQSILSFPEDYFGVAGSVALREMLKAETKVKRRVGLNRFIRFVRASGVELNGTVEGLSHVVTKAGERLIAIHLTPTALEIDELVQRASGLFDQGDTL